MTLLETLTRAPAGIWNVGGSRGWPAAAGIPGAGWAAAQHAVPQRTTAAHDNEVPIRIARLH
jgi:hypothetical protein